MKFEPAAIPGAWIVRPEWFADERGAFGRTFCREEMAAHGCAPDVAQASVSRTQRRGTLRGMHFQEAPHAEAKLVRCARGAIHDVVLDLRRDSPAFGRHLAVRLEAEPGTMLYVPAGCAHGFLTLTDDVEVAYQMSMPYRPEAARGVRWNDPFFAVPWPFAPEVVAERDATYPDFVP